jgi:hypothetical protein
MEASRTFSPCGGGANSSATLCGFLSPGKLWSLSAEALWLMRQIDELHLNYPFASSRMLRDLLGHRKLGVGRRHLRTLMRRMGDQPLKASCIGREFSRIRMEERLGEIQPDSCSNAMPLQPRTAEPLRPDMPANWDEYRRTLLTNRKQKEAAQVQQRMDHRDAREMHSAEFRKERSTLYRGGKWSGNALNVARSLLAADHAKRKAELMERQKRERDSLRTRFGRRKTFEQFLVEQGEAQLAEQWRYRDSETPGTAILGVGDEIPRKRDIRDFTAQVRQSAHTRLAEIHYSSRSDPSHVSFTDRGKRIDVWQAQDEAAVLAALQLGAQKWGTVTITGPDEFKQLCAQLAAQHGFKISKPELQQEIVRGPSEGQPVPVIPTGMPSLSSAYQLHKADILNRIEVRNASQLDWMIAVRMRVTGHDKQAITQALKENASQGREAENRNWTNYAERTAEAVFGPRGDRECARSAQRDEAWARVEGREPKREREVPPSQRRKIPERRRGDFEIE